MYNYRFNDTVITAVVGTTKLDEGGKEYNSAKIHGHEEYSSIFVRNDIGLIHVDKDIEFTENIKPIDLPTTNFDKSNYPAVLSGWGTTSVCIITLLSFHYHFKLKINL